MFGSLAIIVAGSYGLVKTTTALTSGWLPRSLLGTLVLAGLTGIPNLYTAIELAKHGRGSAVVTETMNSNSLNILAGLAIPALVFGGSKAHSAGGYLDIAVLMGFTAAVVAVLVLQQGLRRPQGFAIIAVYLAFVGARVYLA